MQIAGFSLPARSARHPSVKMRLAEALTRAAQSAGEPRRPARLLCGFEPLHLITYLKAHLRLRFPHDAIAVETGLYGDLDGNIVRASEGEPAEGAFVVVEWSDLDPRLGFRSAARWGRESESSILEQVAERSRRIGEHIVALAARTPVLVVPPTLPLPLVTHYPPVQASSFELRLNQLLLHLLEQIAMAPGARVLRSAELGIVSPPADRHDVKMELKAGFPYSLTHTDALAQMAVSCLFPQPQKKGLITDLDQTLWKGILGDDGVHGVSWSLEAKSQAHALYQQMLASLAESGVLLAVASKNEPDVVQQALERSDLLLSRDRVFPVEASWGAKSDAVGRILQAWNVGPDSVVFVDDNPMELAEVAEKHPQVECLQFYPDDPRAVLTLLQHLRHRFGKQEISSEDRLRLESLRTAAQFAQESTNGGTEDFLSRLQAHLRFEPCGPDDKRAFELINKTNQFNLNGLRLTEAEWKARAEQPGRFTLGASYEDRFGPLGRIAVVSGVQNGDGKLVVDTWVMSCRAFSRQIEHQTLRQLFEVTGADRMQLDFAATDRNKPLQTLLRGFFSQEQIENPPLTLTRADFDQTCPTLSHEVTNTWTMSEKN